MSELKIGDRRATKIRNLYVGGAWEVKDCIFQFAKQQAPCWLTHFNNNSGPGKTYTFFNYLLLESEKVPITEGSIIVLQMVDKVYDMVLWKEVKYE